MKKNSRLLSNRGGEYAAIETAAITGTLVDAASAASTDRRGDEGTTMLKMSVQTATHESPIHVLFPNSRLRGWSSSAAAMP